MIFETYERRTLSECSFIRHTAVSVQSMRHLTNGNDVTQFVSMQSNAILI